MLFLKGERNRRVRGVKAKFPKILKFKVSMFPFALSIRVGSMDGSGKKGGWLSKKKD